MCGNPSHNEGGLGPFRGLDAALAAARSLPKVMAKPSADFAGLPVVTEHTVTVSRQHKSDVAPTLHPLIDQSGSVAPSWSRPIQPAIFSNSVFG